jgi:hypothetical protein
MPSNNPEEAKKWNEHQGFWRTLFKGLLRRKYSLWGGAAIYDSGPVAIRWRKWQITHQFTLTPISNVTLSSNHWERAGVLRSVSDTRSGEPYRGRGQTLGVRIISDGFRQTLRAQTPSRPTNKRRGGEK